MPAGNYSVINGEGYKDQYIIHRIRKWELDDEHNDTDEIIGIYDTKKDLNIALNHLRIYSWSKETYKISKVRVTTSNINMNETETAYFVNAIADKELSDRIFVQECK